LKPEPVHLFYETAGSRENCLSFGADGTERKILVIPPLFDEMNRTRRLIVDTMRGLERRGVRTYLPDLPGCNESCVPLLPQSISSWQLAMKNAAQHFRVTHVASIRGACLLDEIDRLPRWRLAPAMGATFLKTLLRTRIAGDKEAGIYTSAEQLLADGHRHGVHLAGQWIGPQMLSELETATPVASTLVTQDALADVAGSPLWLRGEPGESHEMSAALAARLDAWSATCGR
jgi:hypothetical protein